MIIHDLALREILRTVGSRERVITVRRRTPEGRLREVLDVLCLLGLVPGEEHERMVAQLRDMTGTEGGRKRCATRTQ